MHVLLWIRNYLHWLGLFVFNSVLDLEAWFRPRAEAELRSLRDAALMAVGFPALLILGGAALGWYSQPLKAWVIGVGLLVLIGQLLVLAWRRVLIGSILGVLFEYGVKGTRGTRAVLVHGVVDYVNVVMVICFTEVAIGVIALAPLHENPLAVLYTMLAALGLTAYGIWRGSRFVWPKLVRNLLIVTLTSGLLMVAFPPLADHAADLRARVNRWLRKEAALTGAAPTVSWVPPADIRTVPIARSWSPMVQIPPCTKGTVIASHPFRVKDAVTGKGSDLFFPGQSTSRRGEGLPIHGKFHISGEEGGVADVILEDRGKACVRRDRAQLVQTSMRG